MQKAEQKNFRDSKKPSKKMIMLVILLAVLLISLVFLAQTKDIFWKNRNAADEGNAAPKYVLSSLVIGDKLIIENLKGENGNE